MLIVNDVKKMKMKKWSSQWTQFMQLRKEAWKKFRTSTGFDLAITGAMLYQLSYEATDVNDVCDIIVFGNLRFRPSTFKRIDSFFENLHFWRAFWKDAFSVNVFTEYVWTEDKTKADACACWRGLRVLLGPVYMEVG